jgi:hypothetical protein
MLIFLLYKHLQIRYAAWIRLINKPTCAISFKAENLGK